MLSQERNQTLAQIRAAVDAGLFLSPIDVAFLISVIDEQAREIQLREEAWIAVTK